MSNNPTEKGVPNWLLFLFFGSLAVGAMYSVFKHGFLAEQPRLQAYIIPTLVEVPQRSDAVISEGEKLYGQACVACHGANLQGLVGPNLVDAEWWHGDNEQKIYKGIVNGFSAAQSQSGQIMPAKGGANISDGDVWKILFYISSKNGSIKQDAPIPEI
ncbi:MAG: cytochrome c [bacterium]|nr:cytochrome c [bacterium]